MANLCKPGEGFNIDLATVSMKAVEGMQTIQIDHSMSNFIIHTIPTSIFQSLAEGNLLQMYRPECRTEPSS